MFQLSQNSAISGFGTTGYFAWPHRAACLCPYLISSMDDMPLGLWFAKIFFAIFIFAVQLVSSSFPRFHPLHQAFPCFIISCHVLSLVPICGQDWRPYGRIDNYKVRMSNLVPENAACIVSLIRQFKPSVYVLIEQPKGSGMWRLPPFINLFRNAGMFFTLTYLGFYGLEILKATHLFSNMPMLRSIGI